MAKNKRFNYTAFDLKANKINGEIEALNIKAAKAQLQKQGLVNIKCTLVRVSLLERFKSKRIDSAQICAFSRQMATMISSGISIMQSFDIVAHSTDNPKMQALVEKLKSHVEEGDTLAESLKRYPKYFDELFCTLVEVGETSGSLEKMLDRVATYKEKTESLKRKIKKALFYPAAVIIIAIVVTCILLIFVVPEFESMFNSFNAELPTFTRLVIDISEFVQAWWYIGLSAIAVLLVFLVKLHAQSRPFRELIERLSLYLPIFGKVLKKAILARYARTLSTTFAAGMPLVESLETVAQATGNVVYREAVMYVHEEVSVGTQLNVAMRGTNVFPTMMIQLVGIGEESGSLDDMLSKVADVYEEEVDLTIDALSSLLEPIIIVILGVLVGGLVVAMYLPIFQMGSVV
ncbi:MAG: type II secretion system protein F [Legionellales bacterium]|nr:type II secretion system protein F [Legionellales bacterium]